MKIAIIEDQAVEQERLKAYIEQYCRDTQTDVSIDIYNDGIHIVEQYKSQYDVLYFEDRKSVV